MQYPVIFTLMVLIAILSYLQPYDGLYSNLLEVTLSVTTLTMLLLRNTETVLDELQIVHSSNSSTSRECENTTEGVTSMTALLSVFYYFPLLVLLIAAAVWAVAIVR